MEKIKANNLEFNVRVAGLSYYGDAIVLLHGFPQTSHMYEKVMGLLSDNSFSGNYIHQIQLYQSQIELPFFRYGFLM